MVVGMNRAKNLRIQRYLADRARLTTKFDQMRKPTDYKSLIKYLWAMADCQTRGVDPDLGNDIGCGEELGVMRTIQIIENYKHLFKGERSKRCHRKSTLKR